MYVCLSWHLQVQICSCFQEVGEDLYHIQVCNNNVRFEKHNVFFVIMILSHHHPTWRGFSSPSAQWVGPEGCDASTQPQLERAFVRFLNLRGKAVTGGGIDVSLKVVKFAIQEGTLMTMMIPTLPSRRALWSHLLHTNYLEKARLMSQLLWKHLCERVKNRDKISLSIFWSDFLKPGAYLQSLGRVERHHGREAGSLRTEQPFNKNN